MSTPVSATAQDVPLLKTKLYIPPARADLVERPRLLERLNAGLDGKLTLISAPAGFGKTTLVTQWLGAARRPCAWLSLDEGDNDPARFLAYLVAALRTMDGRAELGNVGEGALGALQSPQPPPVEAVLTVLINEMAAISTDIVLVLDDYHLVQAQPVHDAVTFLLDHMPPSMHLVLTTRADPPLPIARLRARGQLVELRQADLRFTPGEAAGFLNQAMDLRISAEDIAALESRTEGWIVGLQLAALSLQGRADAHAFIAAFSGGHQYVLEYLIEEVVRRQPEPVQRFLAQTSILDRLCAPLCDALADEGDAEATLEHLRRHNLFVVPLDSECRWYRYHHLFADLLGNLLRKEWSPQQIRNLHLRACEWYDRNGWTDEAVSHALAARDYQRAAKLVERHSLAMVTRGELTTLLRWIHALPEEVAHSRPWLCVHQAWPLTFAGQPDAVQPLLLQVERQVSPAAPTPEDREILGHVAAMRAMLAVIRGDIPQAVEQAHRADDLLPADSPGPRSIVPFALASAYQAEGDLVRASQALSDELRIGQAAGNLWTIVRSLCDLADLHIIQGRLREATDLCQRALQQAEERGAQQFGTVGYVLVKLGELAYERGELAVASNHVLKGVDLMQNWRQPFEMVSGYTMLATILQALDDAAAATEALQNAVWIQSQHPGYYKPSHLVKLCRVRLCLAQRRPEEAARQAVEANLGETGALLFREREQIALSQVLVAQARYDEALHLLSRLAEGATAGKRFGRLIEILVLQAAALQLYGDTSRALGVLERALAIGEREGYVRVFVEQGAPMATLLQQAAARGLSPDYARKLLATLWTAEAGRTSAPTSLAAAPPVPASLRADSLIEPLTARELEVLQLLGEGRSNQDICSALVITLNTVKKHTSNIYSKLSVHSRTQAVVRAQELGLL
ncbi:MAG: LuxR C-terminal-related transcriptional regulator [Anaerolineae bacterium]